MPEVSRTPVMNYMTFYGAICSDRSTSTPDRFGRRVCANSGRRRTVRQTGQVAPELPFRTDRMNGREARESGLWRLRQGRAFRRQLRTRQIDPKQIFPFAMQSPRGRTDPVIRACPLALARNARDRSTVATAEATPGGFRHRVDGPRRGDHRRQQFRTRKLCDS